MPLVNKIKTIGMLCLENNLATGTFSADRLEVLRLLSSQMAISIENALLYESKQKVDQLIELDHLKSDFFANVSHELRTPLTLMLSPINYLLHETGERLSPNQPKLLRLSAVHARNLSRSRG